MAFVFLGFQHRSEHPFLLLSTPYRGLYRRLCIRSPYPGQDPIPEDRPPPLTLPRPLQPSHHGLAFIGSILITISSIRGFNGHDHPIDLGSMYCIGSAFNAQGAMQCPNCRQIERGDWRYSNGLSSSPDENNDDFDEGLSDSAPPEVVVPLRIHLRSIGDMSEFPSLLDEMEPNLAALHDLLGRNLNTELRALSEPGTSHQGAYLAYLQPLSPSVSVERSEYRDDWNAAQAVHPIDFQSDSPPNNNNGVAEQPGLHLGAMGTGEVDSGSQQEGSLPAFYGNA